MKKYFNVFLEFDKSVIERKIAHIVENNEKGYVCVIESNNLTIANKRKDFNEVVNNSCINICDGSNIAWLLGKIYNEKFSSFTGNDIFIHFLSKRKYRHYFLGNSSEVLASLKTNLYCIDPSISEMDFIPLPFKRVEEFDYLKISEHIDQKNPDFIWVSLGAPKQEKFMSMLLPHLKRGIMVGVGAVFNFNSSTGNVKRAPLWMRKYRLEWLYRACEEPKKNIPRYWNFIKILPFIYREEKKKITQ